MNEKNSEQIECLPSVEVVEMTQEEKCGGGERYWEEGKGGRKMEKDMRWPGQQAAKCTLSFEEGTIRRHRG